MQKTVLNDVFALLQQTTPKDIERTDFTLIRPQPPLPNQQND